MFYVKKAEIYLVGAVIQIRGRQAQNLYDLSLDRDEEGTFPNFFITENDKQVFIPGRRVQVIYFYEDKEANDLYRQICEKWNEVTQMTGIKDDKGKEWFVIDGVTYIGDENTQEKVSDDPEVARVMLEIEQLEFLFNRSSKKS